MANIPGTSNSIKFNIHMDTYIKKFDEIGIGDILEVGGKNASLGEMRQKLTAQGIPIPDGFAVTAKAYWELLEQNSIKSKLTSLLASLDNVHYTNLYEIGKRSRDLILSTIIPLPVSNSIVQHFKELKLQYGQNISVAVRSSATAEDLSGASFAGQQESYLNIDRF
ncbi:PEP/pyruvate-binding domain-containing protein [Fulvivirgaceae bacterium BMA10]|uniref:Phosphoenolpyruvate synthase n=1 Tax=Splendidivirga corallicola TaxID=3051826 RepID=A0ABT8KT41_9BACT|nr:PEP/pyruvate-binding domain-containing protein [Fulvivirgaceae bacterium BMA10]